MKLPDRWIEVSNKRGDNYRVEYNELGQIETKFRQFIDQAPIPGTYWATDYLLELKLVDGNTLVIPCSSVGEYMEITQEGLTNHYMLQSEIHKLHKSVDPEL